MRSFGCALVIRLFCLAASLAASAQTFKTLARFKSGNDPAYVTLAQDRDGNLWGTTEYGGYGTVFRVTPTGGLSNVINFDGFDGSYPLAGLVLGRDNNLYGVTPYGGSNSPDGPGVVFKVSPSGVLTVLHNFDGPDGFYAQGALVQATDGNFYGTTKLGGTITCVVSNCGTIFKITPNGTLTVLYQFDFTHGGDPAAGLVRRVGTGNRW